MRIYLSCMKCLTELGQPTGALTAAHLEESGLYRMKCEHGHETVTLLQQMKFEILFDLGAHAIIDGYYREAVSSFASALERLYEFYIQIQCDRRSLDPSLFTSTWKEVTNQSERQLGAFMFLYLTEKKASPPLLPPKAVKFRNSVVHKGRFPSREEAIQFGEQVAEIMVRVLSELRADAEEQLNRAVGRYVGEVRSQAIEPIVSTSCQVTMISLSRDASVPQPTLRDWIVTLQGMRAKLSYEVGLRYVNALRSRPTGAR
jgi:hypothetical protein